MRLVPARRGTVALAPLFDTLRAMNVVIAGGYAAWAASPAVGFPTYPSDLDLFPLSQIAFEECKRFCDERLILKAESDTAVSYDNPRTSQVDVFYRLDLDVQIVKPNGWDSDIAVIADFDFSVCQAVFRTLTTMVVGDFFMEDMEAKRLRILKVNNPITAINRINKYVKKGFELNPSQAVKIFAAWDSLDPDQKINALAEYRVEVVEPPAEDHDDEDTYVGWGYGESYTRYADYGDDYYSEGDWTEYEGI